MLHRLRRFGAGLAFVASLALAPAQAAYRPSSGFVLSGATSVAVTTAGATVYLGPVGSQTATAAGWVVPQAGCILTGFIVLSNAAPGSGATFNYTVYTDTTALAATGSQSGASSFSTGYVTAAIALAQGATLNIQMVGSSGAASVQFRYAVTIRCPT